MELTIWGLIFIPISFLLLLISPKFFISFLIFSLSLQMTTLINFPSFKYGLQLYRFLTILISIYVIIKIIYNRGKIKVQDVYFKKLFIILFIFWLYIMFISILGSVIFNGYPVFPPLLGLDFSAIYGPSPLEFSILNLFMLLYILFYILSFLYILTYQWKPEDIKIIKRSWEITIFFILFFLLFQFVTFTLGIKDILTYVNTAPQREYSLATFSYSGNILPRLQGTFCEPSMISPFLVGIFIYKFSQKKKKIVDILQLTLMVFLLFLTISTTAFISLLVILSIYLFLNFPVRLKSSKLLLEKNKIKILFSKLSLFSVIIIIIVSILGSNLVSDIVTNVFFKKTETLSFLSRTTADIHSLKLFLNTYLLGVGVGSHRSSSLIANLLATTGIIGTLLFLLFIVGFIKYSYGIFKKTNHFQYFYLVPSAIISMVIAIPNLTFPTFWQFLYITTIFLQIAKCNFNEGKHETLH